MNEPNFRESPEQVQGGAQMKQDAVMCHQIQQGHYGTALDTARDAEMSDEQWNAVGETAEAQPNSKEQFGDDLGDYADENSPEMQDLNLLMIEFEKIDKACADLEKAALEGKNKIKSHRTSSIVGAAGQFFVGAFASIPGWFTGQASEEKLSSMNDAYQRLTGTLARNPKLAKLIQQDKVFEYRGGDVNRGHGASVASTAMSVTSLLAAPVTGGASLIGLIPAGIARISSLFKLYRNFNEGKMTNNDIDELIATTRKVRAANQHILAESGQVKSNAMDYAETNLSRMN